MIKKNEYVALGMMSGSSLDGIDLALCRFTKTGETWTYRIESAQTFSYSSSWKKTLSKADQLCGQELTQLDHLFGKHLGQKAKEFLDQEGMTQPDLIASHGHTIFHQPHKGFTVQIGAGPDLAARTNIPVVNDLRSMDVALGGHGAPLVPAGDQFLFGDYDVCLNLGGIGNLSLEETGKRIAFDICPVNMALNPLAQQVDQPFDKKGMLAKSGKVIPELKNELDQLSFFQEPPPKSIGREWFEENYLPILKKSSGTIQDQLRTVTAHIVTQLADHLPAQKNINVLVTGGGVFNDFLMKEFRKSTSANIVVPKKELIDQKEALIFAFLGVLRMRGDVNCFASVTGAKEDSSGGAVHLPPSTNKLG